MELFKTNGSMKTPRDRVNECNELYNVTIVDGVKQITDFRGYQYRDLYKYSFSDVIHAYGIKQNGQDYVEWDSGSVYSMDKPHVVFIFEMAMGNGVAYPQPTGQFDLYLNDSKLISFTVVKQSQIWEKAGVCFLFHKKKKKAGKLGETFTLDEWIQSDNMVVSGLGYLRVPTELLKGEKTTRFKVVPVNRESSENWFRLGQGRTVLWANIFGGLESLHQGKVNPYLNDYHIYFGDIHSHSGDGEYLDDEGCGIGTWTENFDYARDISGLDFFCMSDHDWQMGTADWKNLRAMTDRYNENGRFATLRGYEWTSWYYGHRNVYFRSGEIDELLDFRSERHPVRFGMKGSTPDDPSPQVLWDWLEQNKLDAITVPHHCNADQFIMNLDRYFNEKYDRLVEIYSCWGCAVDTDFEANVNNDKYRELEITNYLGKLKFGFIASSDGHDGHPGNASLCRGHRYFMGHHLGSGKAAVLADSLDRDSVYDALKLRRCYAVTGAPMGLYFSINDQPMGSEIMLSGAGTADLQVSVRGADLLDQVELIKNGDPIGIHSNIGSMELDAFMVDKDLDLAGDYTYYIKATQQDGETAWSSPIFVTNKD